jgi:hypothetical protein
MHQFEDSGFGSILWMGIIRIHSMRGLVTPNAFEKQPELFERQLELLKNIFSTFPCLKEVIIEIYSAGIKDDVRRRLLSYGFKIESIKNEDDDTDEWYFHEHGPDCDFYCSYDPREYEYDLHVTDDDDEHGDDWIDSEDAGDDDDDG